MAGLIVAPIVGILLAAGRGSRFGSDKLLHRLADGRPLALAAAANLRPACDRLIVVLRPGSETLAGQFAAEDCTLVECVDAEAGMGHSLAAGVRASPDAAGWLVALADMPFVTTTSHRAVANQLRAGASLVASEYQGQRGHPVGFAARWFDQLACLTGDYGGRPILLTHRRQLVLCPVDDPGVLRDIDRPEDIEAGFRSSTGS
jgi:molybdenum cofactor cytidylyltransferase